MYDMSPPLFDIGPGYAALGLYLHHQLLSIIESCLQCHARGARSASKHRGELYQTSGLILLLSSQDHRLLQT